MQRKKRVKVELQAVQEKVGKSLHSMLEQKCTELTIQIEKEQLSKEKALFELQKMKLSNGNLSQKNRQLEQRCNDLETKHGNLVSQLEGERNKSGPVNFQLNKLQDQLTSNHQTVSKLRDQLKQEKYMREQMTNQMNLQLEALSDQLTQIQKQRDQLRQKISSTSINIKKPAQVENYDLTEIAQEQSTISQECTKTINQNIKPTEREFITSNIRSPSPNSKVQNNYKIIKAPPKQHLTPISTNKNQTAGRQNIEDSPGKFSTSKYLSMQQLGRSESPRLQDKISKIIELQKQIHKMKKQMADHEQNRNQSQGVMKKKDEDLRKMKEKFSQIQKKIVAQEQGKKRLQTIIKQRDGKITVLEGKINELSKINQQLRSENKKNQNQLAKLKKLGGNNNTKASEKEQEDEEQCAPVKAKPFLFGPDPDLDF